ncbi:MAG: hypothetical protein HWQ35_12305 [Nostoc sp. NMS1]|uniref:hypothetical protein n=1 Tax=Nostoc sp. NMS1 TaxID=2815388 RepID=UPI0025ECE906|nr:hypothetical protein [Nostoc sp. NMS1]MBN3907309.1 hypothetical protein [Nostoc sp. NMS1]
MTVKLLEPKSSIQPTLYNASKPKVTDELELAQLKLEQASSLSPPFNQQILAYLDDSTREILKSCSINLYLWNQNSFLRIFCPSYLVFSYLKRRKKWIFCIHNSLLELVGSVNEIEVVYQEGKKINVFSKKLIN